MQLYMASRGWTDTPWAGHYYPEDMPPEWRLEYYATQQRAVLVPADRLDPQAAAGWREAVPEGFAFFIELAPGLEPERVQAVVSALAPAGAVAASPAALELTPALGGVPLCLTGETAAPAGHPVSVCAGGGTALVCRGGPLAVTACAADSVDPRALRAALEGLAGSGLPRGLLVVDGAQAPQALEAAGVIAGLLGRG